MAANWLRQEPLLPSTTVYDRQQAGACGYWKEQRCVGDKSFLNSLDLGLSLAVSGDTPVALLVLLVLLSGPLPLCEESDRPGKI